MNTIKAIRKGALAAATATLIVAGQGVMAQTSVDERATIDPDGRVRVENVAGRVEVEGWDSNEVVVTGELGENVERLDFDADRKGVRIEVVHKRSKNKKWSWGWDGNGENSANLVLKIPRESRLTVGTVSADIYVKEHLGVQHLKSVSGNIDAQVGEADAKVRSVSGNIDIVGRDKDIELNVGAVSGDIGVTGFRGDLEAEAVSGDIDVRGSRVRDGQIDCVSGDIELDDVVLSSNGELDIETISGDVSLGLSGNVDAEFRIDSHSGRIDRFFGNKAERTSQYGPGSELDFSVGGGNAEVTITTMSGDVENRISD